MKTILVIPTIVLLTVLLTACNQEPPTPTSIPDNLTDTPVAQTIETSIVPTYTATTIFTSPIEITPPVSESPLVEIDTTEQIIVADAYERKYHYKFIYSTEEWRITQEDGSENPQLVHIALEGCNMNLRDGARGQSPDAIVIKKLLAGLSWFVSSEPQFRPNASTYGLPQLDKGISFFITLVWPEEASEEFIAACQAAAEVVLNTFSLVE